MALPVPTTTIAADGVALLIPKFQTPNTSAVLSGQLGLWQTFETAITDPTTGYLTKIQLANAGTDLLNKYGKIVNAARGAFTNDQYRAAIQVKIAVDGSTADGDALLNIIQFVSTGPYAVRDLDNWGFNAALDIQAGYTAFGAPALIQYLPSARGGGNYVTLRYWSWAPATAGVLVLGSSTGVIAGTTGLRDSVSNTSNNALASVAVV